MRYQGHIASWNDDKGFGFVTPKDGGERAFVHIKAFQRAGRRPTDGDLITYQTSTDKMGRLQARDIQLSGESPSRNQTASRPGLLVGFAIAYGVIFCTGLGVLVVIGRMHRSIAYLYIAGSMVTFLLYAFDKSAALKNRQRTPESTLHLLALAGGWPGALAAQRVFRHKSRKATFQFVFWITVLLNTGALAWLLSPGGVAFLGGLTSTP